MRDPVDDSADLVEDEALDPAAQRIQQKMRRLLMGSSLVMLIGFVAVFAAIFYKISAGSNSVSAEAVAATIALSPDAKVLQVALSEGQLVLLVNEGAGQALIYVDPVTGKKLGRTDFMAR
ncbi:hypothetical protein [Pseudovibrio exalbescens]|uniref:Uncharacterized protein n=1 Tax=Pseudovibrio exalbescens TaxID=197461 RepID=A0A1U7JH93_9HYPH|nr:hypothetical protein [Pseudovibrio exalbescens]OKL44087.1 hypothetical protein A3843_10965 [Pseudovibrio exalbescens]